MIVIERCCHIQECNGINSGNFVEAIFSTVSHAYANKRGVRATREKIPVHIIRLVLLQTCEGLYGEVIPKFTICKVHITNKPIVLAGKTEVVK